MTAFESRRMRRRRIGDGADPDRRLFHRKHLVTTFWALVAGAIGALLTAWWQGRSGPERVYLVNPDTTVRTVAVGDSSMARYLQEVIRELRVLRSQGAPLSGIARAAAGTEPIAAIAGPFQFPQAVKGYLQRPLSTLATASCPSSTFPPGSDIGISVAMRDPQNVSRVSPLFVSVERRDGPTSATLLYDETYEASPASLVLIPAPTRPGNYALVVGYYLKSQLHTAYPPFYRLSCELVVK